MLPLWICLVFCCISAATAKEGIVVPAEEEQLIRERIAANGVLSDLVKSFSTSESGKLQENRDDDCIPEGAECEGWFAGKKCCGVRLRCVKFDTQVPGKSHATWISKCRPYPLGNALDAIG